MKNCFFQTKAILLEKGKPIALLLGEKLLLPKKGNFIEKGKPIALRFGEKLVLPNKGHFN